MYYLPSTDETKRGTFVLVHEAPRAYDRFEALETPVLAHSKLGGRFKVAVPVVVVGINNDRLLVKVDPARTGKHGWGEGEWYVGREWDTVDHNSTREGFWFVRNIRKLFTFLGWLTREMGRAERRQIREQAETEERAHREGRCQICYNDQIVQGGTLVLHGYRRPGHGSIHGDCPGHREPPLEVSCDALKRYTVGLQGLIDAKAKMLKGLSRRDEVMITGYGFNTKPKTYKRGDAGFAQAVNRIKDETESEIQMLARDVADRTEVIKAWKPQKWPRVEPPKDGKKVKKEPIRHERALWKNRGTTPSPKCRMWSMRPPKGTALYGKTPDEINCLACKNR